MKLAKRKKKNGAAGLSINKSKAIETIKKAKGNVSYAVCETIDYKISITKTVYR